MVNISFNGADGIIIQIVGDEESIRRLNNFVGSKPGLRFNEATLVVDEEKGRAEIHLGLQ